MPRVRLVRHRSALDAIAIFAFGEGALVLHLPLAGNPRPFGMPPFAHVLDEADMAAVVSYVRGAWGNDAAPVTPLEVLKLRPGALR